MKKIISILLLSVILCSVYAQKGVGGNVNSDAPIAYADKEFLSGILDYDSLKTTPAPQNWPEPLNNSFKFTYVTGECRMIPPQLLFDAAKKLGVEKEFISDQVESKEYPEFTCKLTGIVIQKKDNEYLVRAFYEAEDIVPVSILNMSKRPWYINDNPKKHIQAIYTSEKGLIKIVDDAYCVRHYDYPLGSFLGLKGFSTFDFMSKSSYSHTLILFGFEKGSEIRLTSLTCNIFKKHDIKDAEHRFLSDNSDLYVADEERFAKKFVSFYSYNYLIEKKLFEYSIDKMLDSNPETSFVENSEDDNISFIIDINDSINIKGFKIINGFAKSENLYKANNQVKVISIYAQTLQDVEPVFIGTWSLKQTRDLQFIELDIENCCYLEIKSTEIYPGTKYNDTSIAEFDILTDEGWLISDK
ncbi:NADase-type glycan-binding domain-containing protein [Treponema sp.]|uniref:NADase-type glycan-binding domain-containing protein n=1 Tax=Treponema sp. TaxID=166 RepID=UPI00298D6396|nr:hypothetical protein [Treponema sp.]MCR5613329.1 hypothetical protein [Treponema sp.]